MSESFLKRISNEKLADVLGDVSDWASEHASDEYEQALGAIAEALRRLLLNMTV